MKKKPELTEEEKKLVINELNLLFKNTVRTKIENKTGSDVFSMILPGTTVSVQNMLDKIFMTEDERLSAIKKRRENISKTSYPPL